MRPSGCFCTSACARPACSACGRTHHDSPMFTCSTLPLVSFLPWAAILHCGGRATGVRRAAAGGQADGACTTCSPPPACPPARRRLTRQTPAGSSCPGGHWSTTRDGCTGQLGQGGPGRQGCLDQGGWGPRGSCCQAGHWQAGLQPKRHTHEHRGAGLAEEPV